MIVGGEVSENEEIQDESALVVGSPKPVEGVDHVSVEPDVGAKDVATESREGAASVVDIAGD